MGAKADAALVNASLIEAKTRAGTMVGDRKALYDSTTDISLGYMKQLGGIMKMYKDKKEKQRIALDKQLQPFQKIADETLISLYSLKEAMPQKVIDNYENQVRKLQERFELVNTLGDGDSSENRKARMQLMGELQRLSNDTKEVRKTAMILTDRIANGKLNKSAFGTELINPAKTALDFKNMQDNPNVTISYGKDGTIFTVSNYNEENGVTSGLPVSFTMKQLDEAFPAIDLAADNMFLEMTQASGKQAIFDSSGENPINKYDLETQRGYFKGKIVDEKYFQNIAGRRLAETDVASFKEALLDEIEIPKTLLSNMFYDDNGERVDLGAIFSQMDHNGDGVITEEDGSFKGVDEALFTKNMDSMIDVLTNINHPAFDFEISKELITDYYVGKAGTLENPEGRQGIDQQVYNKNFQIEKEENDRNNRSYNNGRRTPQKKSSMVFGSYIDFVEQDRIINEVDRGAATVTWQDATWTRNPDGTYSTEGENGTVTLTKEQLVVEQWGLGYRAQTEHADKFDFSADESTVNYNPNVIQGDPNSVQPYKYNDSILYIDDQETDFPSLVGQNSGYILDVFSSHFYLDADGKNENGKVTFYNEGDYLVIEVKGQKGEAFKNTESGMEKLSLYLNKNVFKNAMY